MMMMYLTSGWTGYYLRLASLLFRATGYLFYIEYGTVKVKLPGGCFVLTC